LNYFDCTILHTSYSYPIQGLTDRQLTFNWRWVHEYSRNMNKSKFFSQLWHSVVWIYSISRTRLMTDRRCMTGKPLWLQLFRILHISNNLQIVILSLRPLRLSPMLMQEKSFMQANKELNDSAFIWTIFYSTVFNSINVQAVKLPSCALRWWYESLSSFIKMY
jgi:hypothetical protein